MQILCHYTFAVLSIAAGSMICGAVLGIIVRFVSIEYLYVVRNVPYKELFSGVTGAALYGMSHGFRGGLFLGALLGFAAIRSVRKIAPVRDLLITAAIVPITTGVYALAGGVGAYTAARLTGPFLPEHIALQIGSPYRVLCGYGLEYGAAIGAIISTLVMAVWVWYRRG
ncbi:hypothetical protein QUF75_12200 [Desulfococcaceae bacterium HSG7]|nr:hypothetical protein [Desulfococcaceae bacterium HSG7]